jgi:hypothetical protein
VLENAEGHKLGCKVHAFGDRCTCGFDAHINAAINVGREALAQPEQTPCWRASDPVDGLGSDVSLNKDYMNIHQTDKPSKKYLPKFA